MGKHEGIHVGARKSHQAGQHYGSRTNEITLYAQMLVGLNKGQSRGKLKENKDIVIALNASGADVSYSEIVTEKGHDSFLLNEPEFLKTLKGFIDSMYEKFKNEKRI